MQIKWKFQWALFTKFNIAISVVHLLISILIALSMSSINYIYRHFRSTQVILKAEAETERYQMTQLILGVGQIREMYFDHIKSLCLPYCCYRAYLKGPDQLIQDLVLYITQHSEALGLRMSTRKPDIYRNCNL